MIVLDTNVISEVMRPGPDPNVVDWLAAQDSGSVYLTAISAAELRYGVAVLNDGKRKNALAEIVSGILQEDFRDRMLSFDAAAAEVYAAIGSARRAVGRPISQFDCQIAAIVRAQGAALATRNGPDFEGCGIDVVDPWRVGA